MLNKKNKNGLVCAQKEKIGQKKVEELYDHIIEWIEPLEKEGILKYELTTEIDEEKKPVSFILRITFFNHETIFFHSEEFEVVGAYGRIDMQFGLRKLMIILKEKESDWIYTERYGLEKHRLMILIKKLLSKL
ncbi:hypothetical protein BGP_4587 [Beggiatoa sp. PS]|nr:hypothetical protein BGP_4587 [Beggiatoa sp. PS]